MVFIVLFKYGNLFIGDGKRMAYNVLKGKVEGSVDQYGDQEIKNLVLHTASLLDVLEDYQEVVLITEPIEYIDESEIQQKEEQNAEEEVQEKHVLYAGTRERNN